ncbi:hypothetical protein, partial [Microvirga rosea]|uniref:hypothetical protein n=1 Tax=Microvirga rosea TaxID=2715425 RepID=UPI001D0B7A48
SLIGRDPGIEVLSDDVYGAGLVVVGDSVLGTRPYSRKQRLLTSAKDRLVGRLRRLRDEAAEGEDAAAALAPAAHLVVPFRIGFDGMVGPQPMCAPAL